MRAAKLYQVSAHLLGYIMHAAAGMVVSCLAHTNRLSGIRDAVKRKTGRV